MNPLPPESVLLAPVLATAILLLATHRSWQSSRAWVAGVGTALLASIAATSVNGLSQPLQTSLLPFLALAAAGLAHAYAAWRFAPDLGQRGVLWTFTATLRPTFASGLGIALAQALAHFAVGENPRLLHTSLLVAGAIGAPLVHRRLSSLTLTRNSACHS